ncbi:YicC family protein [Parazoarcus communis]|uniref:YicC family protein n=1 Tax=Parazoarcus communis TaxID=41977 RepID=A0A2U8GSB9_9RHOO|nr:YicC/YloC family endoribonuclease [Parazoarcus communis]AWI76471.1 YicC family protein [Parazoarcus communis]|tara:strand:- start:77404 stop:78270 length:867 start_codon:yes stop_codon:yes gene_type:complete
MIHSMTGFAVQTRDLGPVSLHLELRSVNSRYLDLNFRIVEDLRQAEPAIREQITGRLSRGKVECRLNLQTNNAAPRTLALNSGLLAQLADAQTKVQAQFPSAKPMSVGELLRWPGMLADDGVTFEQMQPAIAELARAALDELVATRGREGEKLAEMIRERIARMRELVAIATPRMPAIVVEYQNKLTARLRDAVATLDEDRIRQEVALYAQRIDVAEELTRLTTHLDELERILKAGGSAGKRLDFLMQELNREANTLASKSPATDITAVAMEMKVLIEQIREQVQNLE